MAYAFLKKNNSDARRSSVARSKEGFTLIEMLVSLSLFTAAFFIATSAFLSVVNADRKSRGTRIATDNLNLMLEDMSRKIKTGSSYSCGGNPGVADCSTPQSVFAFTDQNNVRTIYKRGVGFGAITAGTAASGCGPGAGYKSTQGCVLRSDGGAAFLPSTSPEIDITNLSFYVSGSAPWPDTKQPVTVVSLDGSLGSQASAQVDFKIQTAITQRSYDH